MKKLLLLIAIAVYTVPAQAQNHVPNPSFEDNTGCPATLIQFLPTQWSVFGGSPDYYHECGTGDVKVPNTGLGYQAPANGKAYAGFMPHNYSNHFEYIGTQITPLQRGVGYVVSMSVARSDSSNRVTDNIGVFFYKDTFSYTPISNINSFITVIPQVNYSNLGILRDTNWVRISKYFVADDAYNHIIIGGFDKPGGGYNMDTVKGSSTGTTMGWAYYFIDSVVIAQPHTSVGNIPAAEQMSLYPNPNNGTFTLQIANTGFKAANLTVSDVMGRTLQHQKITSASEVISLAGAAKGVYIVKLQIDDAVYTKRITIE